MEFIESNDIEEVDSFNDLKLSKNILHGIYSYGWDKPSSIQKKAIIPLISKRDTIAQAQSGTGKTGSFSIGSLALVDENLEEPQVLILAPVHDLAIQIYKIIRDLSKFTAIKTSILIGKGMNKDNYGNYSERVDIPEPDFNSQVVVGTPGRVIDCIKRRKLRTENFRIFILDEADEMLSKGFKDQIYNVFTSLPNDIQVGLFSATMPESVLELSTKFMRNPLRILVKKDELTLQGIKQYYVSVENEQQKVEVLKDIYKTISITQTIIFVNSKPKATMLRDILEKDRYTISIIHGGMNQYERNDILDSFRTGTTRILIATDVLARGIDIQQISLVINYDIPFKVEQYLHRIGRSGRYGRKGMGLNLVSANDIGALRKIETFYNTEVRPMPVNYQDEL